MTDWKTGILRTTIASTDQLQKVQTMNTREISEGGLTVVVDADMQDIIDNGLVWRLEGSAGRGAMQMIEDGLAVLGPNGVRDYYGNYVPSRTEVKFGTKGSVAYAVDLVERGVDGGR